MLLAQDAGKTVADQEDLQSRFFLLIILLMLMLRLMMMMMMLMMMMTRKISKAVSLPSC